MTAPAQNMHALEMANEVYRGIARFINETHALPSAESARIVADVFEHDYDDRILGAARVRRLLRAVRKIRNESIDKLLVLASCSRRADLRLRDLTPRQRDIISSALRLWAEGYGIDS